MQSHDCAFQCFRALLVETVVQSITESSVVAQWLRPEGAIQTTGHSSQMIQSFMCVSVCFNFGFAALSELTTCCIGLAFTCQVS